MPAFCYNSSIMKKPLIIGSVYTEILNYVDELPKGNEDFTPRKSEMRVRGSGYEMARVFNGFGFPYELIAPAGTGTYGEIVKEECQKEGIPLIAKDDINGCMYLVKTVFSMLLSIYVILMVREYPFLPVHLSVISAFGVGIPTFFLQLEPSFEKVSGRFFAKALRNSVPSALAVFLSAILCMLVRDGFFLPNERFYGIFVTVTCFIYIYTLYRVYYPPTKLRWGVFAAMGICMVISFVFAQHLVSVSYEWIDLVVIIPMMALEPFLIALIARIYDGISSFFQSIHDFFAERFHHGS
jgi:Sugar kinases, ribokinase family